jgi:hypothetical protein
VKSYTFVALMVIFIFSCTSENERKREDTKRKEESACQYNLTFIAEGSNYLSRKDKLTFLVGKKILSIDKIFSVDSIAQAVKYYKSKKNNNQNIAEVVTIGVKKKDGTFDDVWSWENPITITAAGYGIEEFSIFLDSSNSSFDGKLESRLNISFKTKDYDNGYRLYTLNYIYDRENWVLVSRERINTIIDEITTQETAYCVDTLNNNCMTKGHHFNLTHDYIFRLDDRICYPEDE